MKSVLLLLLVFVVGCSFTVGEVQTFTSVDEAVEWVQENIEPGDDREMYGYADYWASPEETVTNGAGDCEDQALLAMYLIERDLGIKPKLVLANNDKRGHAWVEVDGKRYDPTMPEGAIGLKQFYDRFHTHYRLPYYIAMAGIGRAVGEVD